MGTLTSYTARRSAQGREPQVGVVGAQTKPVFGPRGKHAIWLRRAPGDQIINHDAYVGLTSVEQKRGRAARVKRRVHPRHHPLGGGLFVAGGAVDLSGQKETWQASGFEGWAQLPGVHEIVFDGISRLYHAHLLEAGNGVQQKLLRFLGKGGGNTVGIDRVVIEPLGFEKNPVPGFLGEAHHLVFDGGAISWSAAFDPARIERRFMEAVANHLMGLFRGGGDMARKLRRGDDAGHGGEGARWIVALLNLKLPPPDGAAIEPWWGAGLESAELKPGLFEPPGKAMRRRVAIAAGRDLFVAYMNHAT